MEREGLDRPQKRHHYQGHHIIDGSRWETFQARDNDIIVATSYKAGTTWMQTIIANLLFPNGQFPDAVNVLSPWLDMRVHPLDEILTRLKAQTHQRFVKTHLPLDGLPFFDNVRYVMVGRDPRDVFMSLWNHHHSYTAAAVKAFSDFDETVGRPFPTNLGDIHTMWRNWLSRSWFDWEIDGYPYWSHMRHCQSWWDFRHLENVLLVHFNDLLRQPEAELQRIAAHIGVTVDETQWLAIVDRISFASMKRDFDTTINPNAKRFFEGGSASFMHKGTNGRWRHVLSVDELALYETVKHRVMAPDAAHWLETGEGL